MAIPVFNWKITNPNCGFPIAPGLISWFDIYIYVYTYTNIIYHVVPFYLPFQLAVKIFVLFFFTFND